MGYTGRPGPMVGISIPGGEGRASRGGGGGVVALLGGRGGGGYFFGGGDTPLLPPPAPFLQGQPGSSGMKGEAGDFGPQVSP